MRFSGSLYINFSSKTLLLIKNCVGSNLKCFMTLAPPIFSYYGGCGERGGDWRGNRRTAAPSRSWYLQPGQRMVPPSSPSMLPRCVGVTRLPRVTRLGSVPYRSNDSPDAAPTRTLRVYLSLSFFLSLGGTASSVIRNGRLDAAGVRERSAKWLSRWDDR